MPEFYIKLKMTQIDTESVKGEELDEAVKDALEDLDVDGYEVANVDVSRDNPKRAAKDRTAHIQNLINKVVEYGVLCELGKGDEPSTVNNKRSNAQMLSWSALLLNTIHTDADKPEFQDMVDEAQAGFMGVKK